MHNDLAAAVSGLSPMARWNLSLSVAMVVIAWAFAGVVWPEWPTPLRCMAWFWLVTTLFSPLYIIAANYAVSKGVFASMTQGESQEASAGPTVTKPAVTAAVPALAASSAPPAVEGKPVETTPP